MWLEKLQGHIRLVRNPQNLNLPPKEQKCYEENIQNMQSFY